MRFQSVVAALLILAGAGCSGSPTPGAGSSLGSGASEGDLGRPLDIGVGVDAGGATSNIPFGGACAANEYEGEAIVADLYIMFDQSGSMATPAGAGTRLAAVRGAVTEFVNSPESAGLGVGMGYFGHMPIGHTSCQSADYRAPAVPIGELPRNASAIASSMSAITPVGETPTGSAIRGACGYAGEYQRSNPGHVVSLLLVTDGVPEAPVSAPACAPTLSDAAQAAAECRTGPDAIRTYVLGVGPSLDNLKQITNAGGTSTTYLVEGGNVSAQVLAALNAIRFSATIPCELGIPRPMGGELDPGLVNVIYRAQSGERTDLLGVGAASGCTAGGGWYYDDAVDPHKIVLCERSCDLVKSSSVGQLAFAVGCRTIVR